MHNRVFHLLQDCREMRRLGQIQRISNRTGEILYKMRHFQIRIPLGQRPSRRIFQTACFMKDPIIICLCCAA